MSGVYRAAFNQSSEGAVVDSFGWHEGESIFEQWLTCYAINNSLQYLAPVRGTLEYEIDEH